MRVVELLIEISKNERARRARQSAISRRAAAANPPSEPSAVEPIRNRGIPLNVPPKSHYITNKPLSQQTGPFSGPEFDALRDIEDPTESKGVVLRFHVAQHSKTGNPIVYGYWSHDYAPDFNDAKQLGSIRPLGELYSPITIDLIKELIKKEHNVNIFIDPKINSQLSKSVKMLSGWSAKNASKFNGALDFEIGSEPAKSQDVKKLVNVPTANVRIPNEDELARQIIYIVRRNPELMTKYMSAPSNDKVKALKAGVVTLHKTGDLDSALDDLDFELN